MGAAAQAEESDNGLTENSLTTNSLTTNSLTTNSLTTNSLTTNSLTTNSLLASSLTDPAARTVLKYVVSCALPAGAHIDVDVGGTVYGYDGEIGLAPRWGVDGGLCDEVCQGWVSACVIARINFAGHVVPLSIRGAALVTSQEEMDAYSRPDAVFFGNIFTQPQIRYACLPPGGELVRTCGPGNPLSSCDAVTYLGPCFAVCSGAANDGSFQGCHDCGQPYLAAISVFLQPDQAIP